MNEYLRLLSPNLHYIKHEIEGNLLRIFCEQSPIEGKPVHSRKMRVVKDIPYGVYKVELHLLTKKYFNDNQTISKKTIAESYDFINETGRRTKRLDAYILHLNKEMSTIGLERLIRKQIADVSDTTILRIAKKNIKH
ncbi:MAG: transposase family protein [Candidatus Izemoplasmatales bacterium]|nr:transposase family protein [Candidatus Izemoplasmatales bacterium]